MNKIKDTEEILTTGKAAYVKPTMEVYEMEMEGAIMDNNSGVINEYPYGDGLSKADTGLHDNVFNA